MNRTRSVISAVAGVLLLGLVLSAEAAVITEYKNDLAGWNAATGGATAIEDFSDSVLIPGLSITFGSRLPGSISGGVYHDLATFQATIPTFDFTLPGITAFGAHIAVLDPIGNSLDKLQLTFLDTPQMDLNPLLFTGFDGFYGFTSDIPITQIGFNIIQSTGAGVRFDMDDARITSAATVPEPTTLALLASGLAVVGIARWGKSALDAFQRVAVSADPG